MRRTLLLCAVLVALLGVSSCGGDDKSGTSSGGKPAGTLTLGFVGTLSGDVALNGELSSRGAQLAIDQINADGGVSSQGKKYRFKMVKEDDEGSPVAGVNGVSRLIAKDKVLAILGPEFAHVVIPTLSKTAKNKVIQLYSTNSSLGPDAKSPYAFRVRVGDAKIASAIGDYAAGLPGKHRAGISLLNNQYGESGKELLSAELPKRGIPVVATASHDFGDRDLTSNAAAMIHNKADVVVTWTGPAESILLLKTLRDLGWKGTFMHVNPDSIYAGLGKQTVEGVVGPQGWPPTDTKPISQKFLSAYESKFHQMPDEHSAAYYDAVRLLQTAIQAVGTDPDKIRDYIANIKSWEGVQGTFRPKELGNGDLLTAVSLVKIENGQLKLLRQYE
jgi:branched-chain amino acid transport system substrate-binding protein